MKGFSQRVLELGGSAIKEVAAEVKRNPEVISLAQGLPSFSTPGHIRKKTAQALLEDEKGIGAYSLYSGTRELKRAISARLRREYQEAGSNNGWVKDSFTIKGAIKEEEEIFVTVGAMEGLAASIFALVNPGDEVILPTPNYPAHRVQVRLAGGKPVPVPLREKLHTRQTPVSQICNFWTWNLEDIKKKISPKTKLLILTNPGNPTGCLFDYKLLSGIVALAKEHDFWVLADETYAFLTYEGLPYFSLGIFRPLYEKLIVVRSFSKEYAMTGWRLGYVYAPQSLVTQALKVHDALVGCPSTLSQKGALAALLGSQKVVAGFRKELAFRRELMAQKLEQLSDFFEYTKPAGAYYMWVKIKLRSQNSREFALKLLREAKVAVVPGVAFGPNGEGYVRMCFAVCRKEIEEAFRRIGKFLKKAKS